MNYILYWISLKMIKNNKLLICKNCGAEIFLKAEWEKLHWFHTTTDNELCYYNKQLIAIPDFSEWENDASFKTIASHFRKESPEDICVCGHEFGEHFDGAACYHCNETNLALVKGFDSFCSCRKYRKRDEFNGII